MAGGLWAGGGLEETPVKGLDTWVIRLLRASYLEFAALLTRTRLAPTQPG